MLAAYGIFGGWLQARDLELAIGQPLGKLIAVDGGIDKMADRFGARELLFLRPYPFVQSGQLFRLQAHHDRCAVRPGSAAFRFFDIRYCVHHE